MQLAGLTGIIHNYPNSLAAAVIVHYKPQTVVCSKRLSLEKLLSCKTRYSSMQKEPKLTLAKLIATLTRLLDRNCTKKVASKCSSAALGPPRMT